MTELAVEEPVNEAAMQYINRVSDLLFVLARHANGDGERDVLWVPRQSVKLIMRCGLSSCLIACLKN